MPFFLRESMRGPARHLFLALTHPGMLASLENRTCHAHSQFSYISGSQVNLHEQFPTPSQHFELVLQSSRHALHYDTSAAYGPSIITLQHASPDTLGSSSCKQTLGCPRSTADKRSQSSTSKSGNNLETLPFQQYFGCTESASKTYESKKGCNHTLTTINSCCVCEVSGG